MLLLDEPTTGVDPVSRREFWKLLSEFLSRGLTIVMATPYLDEAERCARVALLHEGRVLAIDRAGGAAGRARRTAARGHCRRAASADRRSWRALPGVEDVQTFGDRAHVRVAAGAQAQGIATRDAARSRARDSRADRPPDARDARRRVHRPHYPRHASDAGAEQR